MTIDEKDILLTGLRRSGTTLVCHLLNKLPNAVALHEPMNPGLFAGQQCSEIIFGIREFFALERNRIKTEGRAISMMVDGKVPKNHLSDANMHGKRHLTINWTSL